MTQPDKNGNNYGRLQKMTTLFDCLHDTYAKFYNPTEHLAVDEVTVFNRRTIF